MAKRANEGVETVQRRWIFRHTLVVRFTHWMVALSVAILLMSGLQIFNAHPSLYWGLQSDFEHPVLNIKADTDGDEPKGITTLFGHSFETTGFLGHSTSATGEAEERAFPGWITVPTAQNLAAGRKWHFFFAWLLVLSGAAYVIHGLYQGRFRRELVPSGDELRRIPHSLWDHVRFRFPSGDEARHYNVLQKLTYLFVIFVILPTLILAGLTMSPGLDTALPQLLTLFGGRQSARTIHFLAASALVAFVIVHLFEVLVSGLYNNLRSMITGRYDIERKTDGQSSGS